MNSALPFLFRRFSTRLARQAANAWNIVGRAVSFFAVERRSTSRSCTSCEIGISCSRQYCSTWSLMLFPSVRLIRGRMRFVAGVAGVFINKRAHVIRTVRA